MSVLRQDPTTKEWVILAPQRAARPHRAARRSRPAVPETDPGCPFCPGNEDRTPPEIMRVAEGETWRIRVVPNLYPVVEGGGSVERSSIGMFNEMEGVGSHEIIIESPVHNTRLADLPPERAAEVLRVWRQRYRELESRPEVRAVVLFKNYGTMAGTSLVHPHSQIVALPVFTPDYLHRHSVATRYFDDTGHCVYEDAVHAEVAAGDRLVTEEGRFVVFCPFAARVPFETWIVPAVRQPSFSDVADGDVEDLSHLLGRVIRTIRRAAADPHYNLVVSSPPAGRESQAACLWYIKILPHLTTAAGFELGSGMGINTVSPEEAAAELRDALAEEAGSH